MGKWIILKRNTIAQLILLDSVNIDFKMIQIYVMEKFSYRIPCSGGAGARRNVKVKEEPTQPGARGRRRRTTSKHIGEW